MSSQNNSKHRWKNIVHVMELHAFQKSSGRRKKIDDLTSTLPKRFRSRIAKLMFHKKCDATAKIESTDASKEVSVDPVVQQRAVKDSLLNENEMPQKMSLKLGKGGTKNWMSNYLSQERKYRVKWNTKIYDMERKISEKPLDEQAEQLMNATAKQFAEWYNSLGSKRKSDELTADYIKSLFSIEANSLDFKADCLKIVPEAVAVEPMLPELAIELKLDKYFDCIWKRKHKKQPISAFGRTISDKEREWVLEEQANPVSTIFPNKLISGENIFKGIGNLRTTKAVIDFYLRHPDIHPPTYLVEEGYFNKDRADTCRDYVPLCELLKLCY